MPQSSLLGLLWMECFRSDQSGTKLDAHVSDWMDWQERAAIMSFDGCEQRQEAKIEAIQTVKLWKPQTIEAWQVEPDWLERRPVINYRFVVKTS